jgi:hypothetical protein
MRRWAIALGALCTVGLAQPVLAYTFYYESAIAYDPVTGAIGWSTGWLYRQDAIQAALRACQKYGGVQCKLALPTFSGPIHCGALSAGSKHHDWGMGVTKDAAISRAMNACQTDDGQTGCKVLVALCSKMGSAPNVNPLPGLGGGGANTCNNPSLPHYDPHVGPLCE